MLAPPSDFGYSPATQHHGGGGHHGGYEPHHQHSGERPKLFGLDGGAAPHMPGLGHHHQPMGDFGHSMHHAAMTPQHHHQGNGGDFDHEPLMMNMHNPTSHFYPPMGAQMLHVSADYPSSMDGTTPSNRNAGSKRSREELNLKEKKRMFKLNDRINELKTLLDEAGVQSKKNKQSILDNTYHYIGMLRSNLLIAKQKAERAEKQAEVFRAQKGGAGVGANSGADAVFKRCFQQSSTPRIVVDLNLEPVTFNNAFLNQTGLNEDAVKAKEHLRGALCVDDAKLSSIIKTIKDGGRPMSTVVQARTGAGVATLTLMASAMTDDHGKLTNIEFSLIPFEISSQLHSLKGEGHESSPSGVSELVL